MLAGELGYESDTKKFKIGDGSTAWQSLDYIPIPDTNRLLTGNLTVGGNFTVNGTTTTIDTTTLTVEDKNIEIGKVTTPSDTLANGGGITLKGTTDKTINWVDSTDSWTLSEHLDLANGKVFKINNTEILSATTLGSSVVSSSLTSVGTIATGVWNATAISGSKVTPDFGSQNIVTTGSITGNDLEIDSGTLSVDATNNRVGIGTTSPTSSLHVSVGSSGTNSSAGFNEFCIEGGDEDIGMCFLSPAANNRTHTIAFGDSNNNNAGKIEYNHSTDDLTLSASDNIILNGDLVGIGTTAPTQELHVTGTSSPQILLKPSDASPAIFVGDSNRSGDGQHLAEFRGHWNGTNVARIIMQAGDDTTNKDNGQIVFMTSATGTTSERLRINESGDVGINESAPSARLHVNGGGGLFVERSAGTSVAGFKQSGGSSMNIYFQNSGSTNHPSVGSNNQDMTFGTNNNERMRISSGGNVLINTTTEIAKLTLKGTNSSGSSCYVVTSSGKAGQGIDLNCTTVGDGNFGGAISFGCGGNGRSAIAAVQSGSDDDRNGLAFFTHHSTTGADNAAEVMRLTSDGRLGIGTTSPDHLFEVEDNNSSIATSRTGANAQLLFKSNSVGQAAQIQVSESSGGGVFQIFTKDTSSNLAERLRIHPAGELCLATTSTNLQGGGASDFYFTLLANTGSNHNGMMVSGVANQHAAHTTRPSANHLYFAGFFLNNSGSGVGNIEVGLSGTSFHTSSDYRLKENVVSISDGITRLKQLLPRRFNWISDETNTLQDGFLAHEVSSIVPEAISGEKDAVATEDSGMQKKDDPVYQTIDHSKLVPLLTAALKESITKIETLETKVAALEAA